MKTVVALSSASFQRNETLKLDQFLLSRIQKKHPKIVLIHAASHDDQGYAKRFKQYFRQFDCEVEAIRLWHTKLYYREIWEMLLEADMIFLGPGDTPALMERIETFQLVSCLKEAYQQGIIIYGLSAGANVLFDYGYSDVDGNMEMVKGIGLLEGAFCPHAQQAKRQDFKRQCETLNITPTYALQDYAGLIVMDDKLNEFTINEEI